MSGSMHAPQVTKWQHGRQIWLGFSSKHTIQVFSSMWADGARPADGAAAAGAEHADITSTIVEACDDEDSDNDIVDDVVDDEDDDEVVGTTSTIAETRGGGGDDDDDDDDDDEEEVGTTSTILKARGEGDAAGPNVAITTGCGTTSTWITVDPYIIAGVISVYNMDEPGVKKS